MARFGYSPATRVFEAAGAGACILTDACGGLETFLEPGTEILLAKDGADVAAQLQALGAGRAKEIGDRARARVLAKHTYAQRAEEVERTLALLRRERGLELGEAARAGGPPEVRP
jgi:spore maturation protein CgeB